jgi:hypothetical protein
VYLEGELKAHGLPPAMDDQDLYFFGLSGDAADNSNQVDKDLKIKDLVDAPPNTQLQLRYPVCFECFDTIIKKLEWKIQGQEKERDIYVREIKKLEARLAKVAAVDEAELEAELRALEAEEQELDKRLGELEGAEADS